MSRPPGRRGGGGRGPRVRKGRGRAGGKSSSGCAVLALLVGLGLIAASIGGLIALMGRAG